MGFHCHRVYCWSSKICIVGRKRMQFLLQCIKFAPISIQQCSILRINIIPYRYTRSFPLPLYGCGKKGNLARLNHLKHPHPHVLAKDHYRKKPGKLCKITIDAAWLWGKIFVVVVKSLGFLGINFRYKKMAATATIPSLSTYLYYKYIKIDSKSGQWEYENESTQNWDFGKLLLNTSKCNHSRNN